MGIPAEQIMIHRSPFLMFDELVDFTESTAVTHTRFDTRPYCVADGVVSEPALAEAIAQTVAALFGSGGSPVPGMLVAIDSFICHKPVLPEWPLEIEIALTKTLGQFCVGGGVIRHAGEILAEGTMKFFIGEVPATI